MLNTDRHDKTQLDITPVISKDIKQQCMAHKAEQHTRVSSAH